MASDVTQSDMETSEVDDEEEDTTEDVDFREATMWSEFISGQLHCLCHECDILEHWPWEHFFEEDFQREDLKRDRDWALRRFKRRCEDCGEPKHRAALCSERPKIALRGEANSNEEVPLSDRQYYQLQRQNCGDPDHIAHLCPNPMMIIGAWLLCTQLRCGAGFVRLPNDEDIRNLYHIYYKHWRGSERCVQCEFCKEHGHTTEMCRAIPDNDEFELQSPLVFPTCEVCRKVHPYTECYLVSNLIVPWPDDEPPDLDWETEHFLRSRFRDYETWMQ